MELAIPPSSPILISKNKLRVSFLTKLAGLRACDDNSDVVKFAALLFLGLFYRA